jgi:hypothetical protein
MTFNGAPITCTWRRFAQQQGAATRSALLHVVEDSIESRMMFLHLHTPIGLMRWGGAFHDTNPKYNRTCSLAVTGVPGRGKLLNLSKCVGRNAGDHLDFGVAPYLYDGLFPRAAGRTNVMQKLYPLRAPITLGSGTLEASNKIFSKHSLVRYRPASALASSTSRLEVCVFDRDGMMVQNSTVVGYASVRLGEGQMVIVSDVAGG